MTLIYCKNACGFNFRTLQNSDFVASHTKYKMCKAEILLHLIGHRVAEFQSTCL